MGKCGYVLLDKGARLNNCLKNICNGYEASVSVAERAITRFVEKYSCFPEYCEIKKANGSTRGYMIRVSKNGKIYFDKIFG